MNDESVKPDMPIEILGDGKYIQTCVINEKFCFTLHPDFIKRIEIIESLLGSQIPLVDFLKNELFHLKYEKEIEK